MWDPGRTERVELGFNKTENTLLARKTRRLKEDKNLRCSGSIKTSQKRLDLIKREGKIEKSVAKSHKMDLGLKPFENPGRARVLPESDINKATA